MGSEREKDIARGVRDVFGGFSEGLRFGGGEVDLRTDFFLSAVVDTFLVVDLLVGGDTFSPSLFGTALGR